MAEGPRGGDKHDHAGDEDLEDRWTRRAFVTFDREDPRPA
jgi:hypothetical protein